MKIKPRTIFNISAMTLIIVLIILIILPFHINNLDQAQRIAIWKSKYEDLSYCFSLVKLYEKIIVPDSTENGKIVSEEDFTERIKPYFDITGKINSKKSHYSYRKMNGHPVLKSSQFFFNDFLKCKDGTLISVKENESEISSESHPSFYMFVDINGRRKPNRIGQDIFFISIFKDNIEALGHDRPYSALKTNCSPIGSGVYCSEYYLLGGKF